MIDLPSVMIQGTTSDAGKSTVVAGLCRALKMRGISVAPFKPQNMALNSAVTEDGGEIGRAQALQAIACGLQPHTDMNPVLIKPSSDTRAQIIILGQAMNDMDAQSFHAFKPQVLKQVIEAYQRLQHTHKTVVVEGAGSPAEINLREGDIANMGFAEPADCPVVLVADIDKGGVFAHLVGTLALLSESEQARVCGFIINKFRGDIALLEPGLSWLEKRTGKPVFGVIPYLTDFVLDSEDAVDSSQSRSDSAYVFKVIVPVTPRMSNHTDFDSLRLHPRVDLQYVRVDQTPPHADLIILPGSKHVVSDLQALKENAWDKHIKRHLRYGGKVIGICGGLQMLGCGIADPYAVESDYLKTSGMGLIPIETTLQRNKTLTQVSAKLTLSGTSVAISGYEIHHGHTEFPTSNCCISKDGTASDGYLSDDGQIFATYLHGLFDQPQACELLLAWAGYQQDDSEFGGAVDMDDHRQAMLDRLAETMETHLDIDQLFDRAAQCVSARQGQPC